jgi:CubicO group peptidase (beta-lactamase class C family)
LKIRRIGHRLPLSLMVAIAAMSLVTCATKGTVMSSHSSPTGIATSQITSTPLAPSVATARITTYLNGIDAQSRLTGSILVAQQGHIILSHGYGWADAELHVANTVHTRFRIGSVSKQFTAMAILMLQDQGKLNVHDPLCKYIDACPAAWQPVTVQNLLTHTSGIPDYIAFNNFPALIGKPATVQDLINRFKVYPLAFTPGTQWSYSNSGYVLLGAIIERLSGMSYADFLQKMIFTPLGMHDSGYDSNTPSLPEHATGYLSPGNKPVYLDMSEFYAAGALYSTVEDLFRWDQAINAGKLVSSADLDDMFTPHIPCPSGGCALPTDIGYGYGWFIANEAGHRLDYHWGRIDGFRSSNGFYPNDGIDIIFLSNLETVDTFGIARQLGTLMLGQP